MKTSFDYVIVGAGSAGCVLANKLSASGAEVALLEAGPKDGGITLRMPAAFILAMSNEKYDWGYLSEPEPHLDGRRIPCPRGRVLGGSSSINAMAFVRGQPADFESWRAEGLYEWSWEACLQHFQAIERFNRPGMPLRGYDGPLLVTAPGHRNVLYGAFLRACAEAGHTISEDTNGPAFEGFGPMDQTIAGGQRMSASRAFLEPAANRPNLTIFTGAKVNRVLIEGGRAAGVEALLDGAATRLNASRETLLAAGTFNSPQLLMLSGIGAEEDLKPLGIRQYVELPAVGRNLQDHVDYSVKFGCAKPVSETPDLGLLRRLMIGIEWMLTHSGSGATNHFEVAGYIRSSAESRRPDVQICFMPLISSYDGTKVVIPHGFTATVMNLQPRSRGRVSLAGADAATPPSIRFNFLEDPFDLEVLTDGLYRLREIMAQPAMRDFLAGELLPGAAIGSREDVSRFIRATGKSTRHACGTCRMSIDGSGVVDQQGRVHGVEGLRVVDASIMPSITSGNINAVVMMMADKIATRMAVSSGEAA